MYNKLNPFVRFACDVVPEKVAGGRRVGVDHRIFYVKSGFASLDVGGVEYRLREGTLLYIPAYHDYSFEFFDDAAQMLLTVINFDFDAERSDLDSSLHTMPYSKLGTENLYHGYIPDGFDEPLIIADGAAFYKDMQKLRTLFFNKEEHYKAIASSVLKALLIAVIQKAKVNKSTKKNPTLEVITYVKEHYAERIVAGKLAAEFNYHPNHLNRLVKSATGKSFKEFLISYRIKVAKDMLVSTAETVAAIAARCGFFSTSYFSELFFKQTGLSPKEYRRIARERVL